MLGDLDDNLSHWPGSSLYQGDKFLTRLFCHKCDFHIPWSINSFSLADWGYFRCLLSVG